MNMRVTELPNFRQGLPLANPTLRQPAAAALAARALRAAGRKAKPKEISYG